MCAPFGLGLVCLWCVIRVNDYLEGGIFQRHVHTATQVAIALSVISTYCATVHGNGAARRTLLEYLRICTSCDAYPYCVQQNYCAARYILRTMTLWYDEPVAGVLSYPRYIYTTVSK